MKTHKQKNCSVASYNRQVAKYGKANCNIMYKCHLVKITELNVSLGSKEEVAHSVKSTESLFEKYIK